MCPRHLTWGVFKVGATSGQRLGNIDKTVGGTFVEASGHGLKAFQTVNDPFDVISLFVAVRLETTILNLLAIDILHLRFGLRGRVTINALKSKVRLAVLIRQSAVISFTVQALASGLRP